MAEGDRYFEEVEEGEDLPPFEVTVTRTHIVKFAGAGGDFNPIHHDEEYARKQGYDSIVAPPAFVAQYAFPVKRGNPAPMPQPKQPLPNRLNGGTDYEFLKPVVAGDVLTATSRVVDIYERKGQTGPMLFTVRETAFKNQRDEIVLKFLGTDIAR